MSLYSLATDLFADMDRIRATAIATEESRKDQRRRTPQRVGQSQPQPAEGEGNPLVPRLAPGGSDVPPTLELLEGCLCDVQKSRLGVGRRRQPAEPASGRSDASSSPPSKTKPFPSEEQQSPSPRGPNSSRKRSTTVDAAVGGPDSGDRMISIVQNKTSTVDRAPDKLGVWRTPPPSISRSSPSSSGSGKRAEGAEAAIDGEVSADARKHRTTGAFESCSVGGMRDRFRPRDTDSAMDRAGATRNGAYTDEAATASFVDFERELRDWRLSDCREKKASSRDCAKFAAHLSEKYLCNTLDPMPSSPVVCCLRREIARRIDALAKEEDTPPGVANGDGRQREDRGIRELGAEHVPTAPRFKYGDADSNGGSSRPLNNGGGDSSLPADEESREYSGASANWWAGRSGMLHSTSVRPGVAASGEAASDIGNTALTRRVKRPEEFSKTSLRDELGGQISDARSNSSNSSNTSSNTSSSSSEPAQGLDGMRRALAELDGRDSTREAAQRAPERERHAVEFPRIPSRSNNKRRGYSNRSSRPDDGEPRARTVRFLLEEKKEETNVNGVAIGEAVEGVSQTTQKKGRRYGLNAGVGQRKAETTHVEDGESWTCVVCRTQNDELEGADGCTTCGRRRRRRPLRRGGGTRLDTVPADILSTGNSRKLDTTSDQLLHERETGEINQSVKTTFTANGTRTHEGSTWEKSTNISASRNTPAQSERRGPYDISSFAKMRQATQPIVSARLGLTREIQSLLSSIRR